MSEPGSTLTYDVAWRKIRGKVREKQEDFYRVESLDADRSDGPLLAVVADGMGRHGGGDVAARVAVRQTLSTLRRELSPLADRLSSSAPIDALLADAVADALSVAFHEAHGSVVERAERDRALANMGTTVVAAIFTPAGVHWSNVGDSRLLWLHDGELRRVSRDHSVAQVLVDLGQLDEAQMERHPMAANLTSFLGPGMTTEELRISPAPGEASWFRPEPGDVVALCTDGVTGSLTPSTLAALLGEAGSARQGARRALSLVMQTEARDNATIVVAAVYAIGDQQEVPWLRH